jgi:hypothetical protein
MSSAVPLTNQDYLGRCYDIVEIDPLDLGKSAKYENAIDIQAAEDQTVQTRDGTFLVPLGVEHKGIFSMSWESQSRAISSSHDFQEEFKRSVTAEAGVPGGFEFSGSASYGSITRETESRKHTFVYSRAYQENHGLHLHLDDEDAPIQLAKAFHDAVTRLPVGQFGQVRDAYRAFVQKFGTHFTTEIILGGLALQRTSGSVAKFLSSKEREEELKAHASVEVEAFKAGAGAEQAKKQALSVDRENELSRTSLEFRGGEGSPSGIDDGWIRSLHERPAIVKAKLERLTELLTGRFFPDHAQIEEKQTLLGLAIDDWILEKGRPGCDTPPLKYGEQVVLAVPVSRGYPTPFGIPDPGVPAPGRIWFPIPRQEESALTIFVLESATGRRDGGAILAGDQARIRLADGGLYIGPGGDSLVNQPGQAAVVTVTLKGDDPAAPARAGQYVVEPDELQFFTGAGGLAIHPSGRYLYTRPGASSAVAFSLRRAGTEQD